MQVWRDYRLIECETTMRRLTPIAIREVAVFNTEDVAPVTHAHNVSDTSFMCSNCTFADFGMFLHGGKYVPKYCPNCGAKMDEVN